CGLPYTTLFRSGEAAVEIAGQRLRGGGFVEDRRVLLEHVVAQSLRGAGPSLAVEGESREEPGRQLVRVEVPALVDAALEVATHEAGMQTPRPVDVLGFAQGQNVRRT